MMQKIKELDDYIDKNQFLITEFVNQNRQEFDEFCSKAGLDGSDTDSEEVFIINNEIRFYKFALNHKYGQENATVAS